MAAKKQVKSAAKGAPKSAPKAAAKAAPKKAAKPAAKKAAAKPAAPTMSEVEHTNAVERAEHAHQDPRGTPSQIHKAGTKVQPQNFGEVKARSTRRLDVVKNWFRRGEGR